LLKGGEPNLTAEAFLNVFGFRSTLAVVKSGFPELAINPPDAGSNRVVVANPFASMEVYCAPVSRHWEVIVPGSLLKPTANMTKMPGELAGGGKTQPPGTWHAGLSGPNPWLGPTLYVILTHCALGG